MSDTPRTDAARQDENDPYMAVASECSKLERELNAANAEIEEKHKDVVWLATEKAKLENYVKRLEDAGDYIAEENDIHIGKEVWRKAKEAKP